MRLHVRPPPTYTYTYPYTHLLHYEAGLPRRRLGLLRADHHPMLQGLHYHAHAQQVEYVVPAAPPGLEVPQAEQLLHDAEWALHTSTDLTRGVGGG